VGDQCVVAGCVLTDTLSGSNTYTRTAVTMGAPSVHAGSCGEGNDGGLRSPEIVYRLVLSTAVTNVNVSTDSASTDYDTLVYMRSGTCTGPEVKCDDDMGGGASGSVFDTGPLTTGDYYIFIDGFGGRSGTAQLTVTITP
jgi:hypothetical protein